MDDAFNRQEIVDEYGDSFVNEALKIFDEKEEVIYIRNISDAFVSFSTLKEKGPTIDILYTFNRTNLELREVVIYDDEFYSQFQDRLDVNKETIKYFDCEAPKV